MHGIVFALSVVLFAPQTVAPQCDDLEPCEGVFSWIEPPSTYRLALRAALIGEHSHRECQVLAIPSFEREWAVYILRGEGESPRIVFNRMREHLWPALTHALSTVRRCSNHPDPRAEKEDALQSKRIDAESFTAPLSDDAADVLEQVWSKMLRRVRYPDGPTTGRCDGTTYHVFQWIPGEGSRSGTAWSPDEDSRTGALVHLAEEMCRLTEAPPQGRRVLENVLLADARALLSKLEALSSTEDRR